MTVAFKNCEAMRNLVTGRAVPQPTLQVTAKPLGLDLGMEPELGLEQDLGLEPDQGMEPDLGMGPDKGRAGDSNVAALKLDGIELGADGRGDARAVFQFGFGEVAQRVRLRDLPRQPSMRRVDQLRSRSPACVARVRES